MNQAMRAVVVVVMMMLLPTASVLGDEARPNVVLIVVDDLGWRDLAFMGSDFHRTPHIDRLAEDGLAFTHAYSNAANCAPSRAALMSGQYAPRTEVYTVLSADRGRSADRRLLTPPMERWLKPSVVTIAEVLASAGYATAAVGKWHLGSGGQGGPQAQGFDVNVGGNRRGAPRSYFSPYENPDLPDGQAGEHLTDRLTDEAIEFIGEHRAQPFFLYLSYFAVHTPLQPQRERLTECQDRRPGVLHNSPTYAAMVEGVDANVGRLLAALDDMELADDTLVVLTSDNGGHAGPTRMTPLRGSKGMFYEGGIRVPLVARWPGRIEKGTTSAVPVIGLDLYPTLVEVAGVSLPDGQMVDGVSLVPLLVGDGRELAREAIYWHFPAYLEAGRGMGMGPWRTTPCSVIRSGHHKLIEFLEDGHLELYDLQRDENEAVNLAESQPELAAQLYASLDRWRSDVGAAMPPGPNPEYVPERRTEIESDTIEPKNERPPNIVYILADDLGFGELGCYGQEKIETPNLDRLAEDGMRFLQHYSGSPVCAPSRCTLLTGLHAGHSYVRDNRGRPIVGQQPIPPKTATVARRLQDQGYATACVGKWGLGGPDSTGVPWRQGFDFFYGYLDQWRAHSYHPTYLYRNGMRVPLRNDAYSAHQKFDAIPADDPTFFDRFAGEDYAPDLMIEAALQFVSEHAREPFFLYYATPVPHVAIQVPEDSVAAYPESWDEAPYLGQKGYLPHRRPRAAYAGMISRMDRDIGRLLDALDALGLTDNTIVFFTSDNGPTYAGGVDAEFFRSAGGLRGLKGSVFEGGLRVPFIARWPGRIEAGSTSNHVSAFWDMFPTFLELAGGAAPDGLDGHSLVPTLLGRGGQVEHDALYWELGRQQAVRAGDLKLVRRTNREGVTTAMLFDLADDPAEQHDLARSHPKELAALIELARGLRVPSAVYRSVYDDER